MFWVLYAFFWIIPHQTPGSYPEESIEQYKTSLMIFSAISVYVVALNCHFAVGRNSLPSQSLTGIWEELTALPLWSNLVSHSCFMLLSPSPFSVGVTTWPSHTSHTLHCVPWALRLASIEDGPMSQPSVSSKVPKHKMFNLVHSFCFFPRWIWKTFLSDIQENVFNYKNPCWFIKCFIFSGPRVKLGYNRTWTESVMQDIVQYLIWYCLVTFFSARQL